MARTRVFLRAVARAWSRAARRMRSQTTHARLAACCAWLRRRRAHPHASLPRPAAVGHRGRRARDARRRRRGAPNAVRCSDCERIARGPKQPGTGFLSGASGHPFREPLLIAELQRADVFTQYCAPAVAPSLVRMSPSLTAHPKCILRPDGASSVGIRRDVNVRGLHMRTARRADSSGSRLESKLTAERERDAS
eukprot:4309306-Pleurochrysis_carterae.AAC.2